jgi:hypothetical protein
MVDTLWRCMHWIGGPGKWVLRGLGVSAAAAAGQCCCPEPGVASHQVNSIMGSARVEVRCCPAVELLLTCRIGTALVKRWSRIVIYSAVGW